MHAMVLIRVYDENGDASKLHRGTSFARLCGLATLAQERIVGRERRRIVDALPDLRLGQRRQPARK